MADVTAAELRGAGGAKGTGGVGSAIDETAAQCLKAVRQFADMVLRHGRDVYGSKRTPLLVDGLHVDTLEPATWRKDGETWVLSNLANQQHFFRTLDGLSALTGEPAYRDVAVTATRYGFDHLQDPNGMLYWGGHVAYDLAGERLVMERHNQELKAHYPYYQLMWLIDPVATKRMLEASWEGHILDWSNLDMNRHGRYEVAFERAWQHEYAGGPVFFVGKGLTFCNTGSDLIYAAGLLHHFTGETPPLEWAKRMAHRYVETRNQKTGLGGYQYSRIENDRAAVQFGPEFGERALEGTILDKGHATLRYGVFCTAELLLGEILGHAAGQPGEDFVRWAADDLAAYARHAYDTESNRFRAMFSDGTALSPGDIKRPGYYKRLADFSPWAPEPIHLWAYAIAFRLTRDPIHWQMVVRIARGLGLAELDELGAQNNPGNLDEAAGMSVRASQDTAHDDPHTLLALLDLHHATGDSSFLELAARVAGNLLNARFQKGFFLPSADHVFGRVGALEPLALLRFVAAARGADGAVPAAWPADPYFQAPHDGLGRSRDTEIIYGRRRSDRGVT